jgi:hypothetical protein
MIWLLGLNSICFTFHCPCKVTALCSTSAIPMTISAPLSLAGNESDVAAAVFNHRLANILPHSVHPERHPGRRPVEFTLPNNSMVFVDELKVIHTRMHAVAVMFFIYDQCEELPDVVDAAETEIVRPAGQQYLSTVVVEAVIKPAVSIAENDKSGVVHCSVFSGEC